VNIPFSIIENSLTTPNKTYYITLDSEKGKISYEISR